MVMVVEMNLIFSNSVWAPIPSLTCLDLHVAIVILRATLRKESRPIWGFDMRKSLYMIGLIHWFNPKYLSWMIENMDEIHANYQKKVSYTLHLTTMFWNLYHNDLMYMKKHLVSDNDNNIVNLHCKSRSYLYLFLPLLNALLRRSLNWSLRFGKSYLMKLTQFVATLRSLIIKWSSHATHNKQCFPMVCCIGITLLSNVPSFTWAPRI
jgi:hypothetical protein